MDAADAKRVAERERSDRSQQARRGTNPGRFDYTLRDAAAKHREPSTEYSNPQMLGVSNLGKRYGPRWLFRNLEFDLTQGDCLVVIGPNGSGKSTLLKVIAGLSDPTEGQVTRPKTLGYSAIDLAVYPALTAAEHLDLTGNLRGCEPQTDELLQQVGLEKARNQIAQEFSTGMRARLKLAIALQPKPDLLLLDEPGAGLDEAGRNLIEEVIHHQLKTGAVMLATNEPSERRFANMELEIVNHQGL